MIGRGSLLYTFDHGMDWLLLLPVIIQVLVAGWVVN